MREIKFRAWIREGEWDEEGTEQAYKMCYDLAFEDFEPINDLLARVENLMQYTGLKDKRGKGIYEGDILLVGSFTDSAQKRLEVKFNHATSGWDLFNEYGHVIMALFGSYVDAHPEDFEVVGNVYENVDWRKF